VKQYKAVKQCGHQFVLANRSCKSFLTNVDIIRFMIIHRWGPAWLGRGHRRQKDPVAMNETMNETTAVKLN
jgi:hypothetical protein